MSPTSTNGGAPRSAEDLTARVHELEEQVRLYEAVLATGPVFAHVYDGAMNSRWATSALRPELGYQLSDPLSAEENYALVHPDDRERAEREARQVLQGDRVDPSRIRVRDADGDWRWLAILAANLLDDRGVGSIVVHSWDITDEVRREEEVQAAGQLLTALIDTLDEGVVVVSDGRVALRQRQDPGDCFPGLSDSPHKLIGRCGGDRGATGLLQRGWLILRRSLRRRDRSWPTARSCDGGSSRPQTVGPSSSTFCRSPSVNVSPAGCGCTAMSPLNSTFQRRQKRLLEMERATRRSVEEQNDRLRELDEPKTAFVATVSHELRTPLSALPQLHRPAARSRRRGAEQRPARPRRGGQAGLTPSRPARRRPTRARAATDRLAPLRGDRRRRARCRRRRDRGCPSDCAGGGLRRFGA